MAKHPELKPGEYYLGNFDPERAKEIGWKTKRPGIKAFKRNGDPYPNQEDHGVLPYFVQLKELQAAGVDVSTEAMERLFAN